LQGVLALIPATQEPSAKRSKLPEAKEKSNRRLTRRSSPSSSSSSATAREQQPSASLGLPSLPIPSAADAKQARDPQGQVVLARLACYQCGSMAAHLGADGGLHLVQCVTIDYKHPMLHPRCRRCNLAADRVPCRCGNKQPAGLPNADLESWATAVDPDGVTCPNGCEWRGRWSETASHLTSSCRLQPMACALCPAWSHVGSLDDWLAHLRDAHVDAFAVTAWDPSRPCVLDAKSPRLHVLRGESLTLVLRREEGDGLISFWVHQASSAGQWCDVQWMPSTGQPNGHDGPRAAFRCKSGLAPHGPTTTVHVESMLRNFGSGTVPSFRFKAKGPREPVALPLKSLPRGA